MALDDPLSPRDLALGFALGLAAAAAFPALTPALRERARPLAKTAVKLALATAENGRDRLAEWQEALEDLVAEVQHELASERGPSTGAAARAAHGANGSNGSNGSAA